MALPAAAPAKIIPLWRLRERAKINKRIAERLDEAHAYRWGPNLLGFYAWVEEELTFKEKRYLGLIDRYYLLVWLLRRSDVMDHGPKGSRWLYERCREVEAAPDGHLDLWAREHYKLQMLSEPTPTPTGWKAHGDLIPGDEIFGPDGQVCRVLALNKIVTDADCYEIEFDDGFKIKTGAEHLWPVERRTRKRIPMAYKKPGPKRLYRETVLMQTAEIAAHDHKQDTRLAISVAAPLDLPEADLPIDPYVLGCWLGDGSTRSSRITVGLEDADELRDLIIDCGAMVSSCNHTNSISLRIGEGRRGDRTSSEFTNALRDIGVYRDKHVPSTYQRASIDQRLALLQGLMDTDGTCNTRGTATFVNTNDRLVDGFVELAHTLGLKPRQRYHTGEYEGRPYPFWQVSFQAYKALPPFRLTRKLERCKEGQRPHPRRFIVGCRKVPSEPMRCIQVDRPDGLYLTGRAMVPTHNSTIITFAGTIQEILRNPEITIGLFSFNNKIAKAFLGQIMHEMEQNEDLRVIYQDVLWWDPRKQAPRWSRDAGIVVKRRSNPKEGTIQAHGLVDGQPTSMHFDLRIYDDVWTRDNVTNEEQIKKTKNARELSDNLGKQVGDNPGREWNIGTRYCMISSMRILMSDWRHKPISEIKPGDEVVGWIRENGKRWLRRSKVKNVGVHKNQSVRRYTLKNGRSVTCTADHNWWRGPHGSGTEYRPIGLHYHKGRHLCCLLDPTEVNETRDAAWLAGYFDGEGTISKNTNHPSGSVVLTQTMHNPDLLEYSRQALKRLDFRYSEQWHSPSKNLGQESWNDRCNLTITGGWRERYRFLVEVDPVRREKISDTLYGHLKTKKEKLLSDEDAGFADVYWIETETGNYIAEGFCSKNSYADGYGEMIDNEVTIPRIYPATDNGQISGNPVFFSDAVWADKKKKQGSTLPAQLLQNPLAGQQRLFEAEWFKPYWVRPRTLNVYILCDPSKGSPNRRTDRTGIAVIGVDANRNKYLLDGYRHRMKLPERWMVLKALYKKWKNTVGVMSVKVGYERYGKDADIEHFETMMKIEKFYFRIEEVAWSKDHQNSKADRVERMAPDMKESRFFLPAVCFVNNKTCHWEVEEGRVKFSELRGQVREWQRLREMQMGFRIPEPIRRVDEAKQIYDVTEALMEELIFFPYGKHDDLCDAASRVYDMSPAPPKIYHEADIEPETYVDT